MSKARGMSCGGRSRLAGSGWLGSGWAARRFCRSCAPGVEVVDPGLDGEDPVAELVDGEGGGPEVVGEGGHGAWSASRASLACL